MLTIREAMKISPLIKTRLVGGRKGIDNVIKSVTVMEVPDIVHWIKGGEFLITSFYFMKDVNVQLDILHQLSKFNAAGLAIKISDGKSIHENVIKEADRMKFPLVEIPDNVTYLDIMTPLNHKIFEIEQHFNLVEEYIKSIMFHTYKNIENIIDRGKSLGYNIEREFIYTICVDTGKIDSQQKYNSIYVKDSICEFVNNTMCLLREDNKIVNYSVVRNIEDATVLIQAEDRENCKKTGRYVLNLILNHIDINYKGDHIYTGIGNVLHGIAGVEEGYEQSKNAIRLGRVINGDKNYCFYRDVELYSIFYKNYSENISYFGKITLGKLVEDNELMETISMYFECNENILNTSNRLFIHKNTLKYRLKNIEKITGLDMKKINDKIKLYFGVVAYKIESWKKRN